CCAESWSHQQRAWFTPYSKPRIHLVNGMGGREENETRGVGSSNYLLKFQISSI
ncbi:hypothetical protein KIN20_020371, partial [Parelaphostrongylus tenuis]